MRPYVGITGFMSGEEIGVALRIFRENKGIIRNFAGTEIFQHKPDYMLMVGVLANLDTIYGNTQKHPNRYPDLDAIPEIFSSCPIGETLRLIHYDSKLTETLYIQLMALAERVGLWQFDGFQLNIVWPPPLEILAFKSRYPRMKIILRVGSDSFTAAENSSGRFIDCLTMYSHYRAHLLDYVLLDLSGGEGKVFEPEKSQPYLRAIIENMPMKKMGIGVAGLSGSTMHLLKPLVDEFSCFSIVAEAELRNENDHLDLNLVENCISKGFEALGPKAYFKNLSL